ncbi:MAG TPA: hypothetical protein VKF61_04935 [Candidatus Polarisedimenticolia bacterium]|nr:hypothetical protein [Candidatus Polarisedimenticolia bacterium]
MFSNLGGAPTASFFALGAAGLANSGMLPASAWLVNLGDLNGDGLPEWSVEAPGTGDGGWGDPRTVGCPSTLSPSRPPLVIQILHDQEDRDDDGVFDVFEDRNHNTLLDQGEDRDGDGRLTPRDGCEGTLREDVDCDGHIDYFWEDLNNNHVIDVVNGINEDRDGDRKLDYIDEDRNHNGVLDPGEDRNQNGRLDTFDPSDPYWNTHPHPYIEDRNFDQILNDRPRPQPTDVIYEYFPDGTRRQIEASYPYGSFVPAPGAIVTALVTWNGVAYDLSDMPASTRLIATTQDLSKAMSGR